MDLMAVAAAAVLAIAHGRDSLVERIQERIAREPRPAGRRPSILVVLTRGINDDGRASRLIADLSALVHAHNGGGSGPLAARRIER